MKAPAVNLSLFFSRSVSPVQRSRRRMLNYRRTSKVPWTLSWYPFRRSISESHRPRSSALLPSLIPSQRSSRRRARLWPRTDAVGCT